LGQHCFLGSSSLTLPRIAEQDSGRSWAAERSVTSPRWQLPSSFVSGRPDVVTARTCRPLRCHGPSGYGIAGRLTCAELSPKPASLALASPGSETDVMRPHVLGRPPSGESDSQANRRRSQSTSDVATDMQPLLEQAHLYRVRGGPRTLPLLVGERQVVQVLIGPQLTRCGWAIITDPGACVGPLPKEA
jgi:hypothetical protein